MQNLLTLTLTLAATVLLALAADKLALKPIEVQSEPTPYTFDTTTADGKLPDIDLRQDGELLLHLTLTTNVVTQWVPLRQVDTNGVRSIGFLTTNRVALLVHDGRTNAVLLKQLGQEEFPSQRTTNRVVDPGDPRQRRFGGPAR